MDLKTRAECLDFIHGFAKSQMLFTAVELGVFEKLGTTDNLCAADIAKQIEADVDATERLLNACASIGFLSKNEKGLFSNTEKAIWCLKSTKGSLYGDIIVNKHSCYYAYGCLSKAVNTGKNCAFDVFGVAGDKLYTFGGGYYKDERSTKNFVQAMTSCSFGLAEGALDLFDLSKYKTVCDLGGSSGLFCLDLRQKYPTMNIILFDLPQVIEINKKYNDVKGDVVMVPGDFFKDPFPEADVYMLNHILEDWSEANGKILLKKVFGSLPIGGALIMCNYCLPQNKVADSFAHVVDLNQLASCEGKMRTFDEWEALIMEAGEFSKVERKGSSSYFGDVIMATK